MKIIKTRQESQPVQIALDSLMHKAFDEVTG